MTGRDYRATALGLPNQKLICTGEFKADSRQPNQPRGSLERRKTAPAATDLISDVSSLLVTSRKLPSSIWHLGSAEFRFRLFIEI